MDDTLAIHPDGTPVNPEKMRDALRRGEFEGEQLPATWMGDQHLVELVEQGSLRAFTDYMQQINYERMFDDDGAAKDIKEWRQSVRDDTEYQKMMMDSYPDVLEIIVSGTDEQVQNMLRAHHNEQQHRVAEWESKRKAEL